MENISKALILAIQYLGCDRNDEEYTEEDDLKIVEAAAAILSAASEDEKAALERVAEELGLTEWVEQIGLK